MDSTNWKAARQRYAQYAAPDFTPENAYITAYTSPGYANFGAQPDMYVPPGSTVMPSTDPYSVPAPAGISPTLADAAKKAKHRHNQHHGGHHGGGHGGGGQGGGQGGNPGQGPGQYQGGGAPGRGPNWIQQRVRKQLNR